MLSSNLPKREWPHSLHMKASNVSWLMFLQSHGSLQWQCCTCILEAPPTGMLPHGGFNHHQQFVKQPACRKLNHIYSPVHNVYTGLSTFTGYNSMAGTEASTGSQTGSGGTGRHSPCSSGSNPGGGTLSDCSEGTAAPLHCWRLGSPRSWRTPA